MTDAELLGSFTDFVNTSWMIFTTYVSVLFAFLVAGYLVSSKLGSKMAVLVTSIYTLVALWAIFGINTNLRSVSAAVIEIKRVVRDGDSSLSWLPIVSMPDYFNSAVPILVTFITVAAYLGSVVFFFYQRRRNGENGT